MSTTALVRCDAPLCDEAIESGPTMAKARERAKRLGWVEARTNRRVVDYCPSHSNLRINQ